MDPLRCQVAGQRVARASASAAPPAGNGLWLDKQQRQCLVLWKTLPEWAQAIYQWARSLGGRASAGGRPAAWREGALAGGMGCPRLPTAVSKQRGEAWDAAGAGAALGRCRMRCVMLCHAVPCCAALRWPGLVESVLTLEEVSGGDEARGSELEGLHREVLLRALRLLEQQGKAK